MEEEAADVGGPKKEFFFLMLEGLLGSTSPHIFEGQVDHKIPVHSQQATLQEIYLMTGKAIAHAAIHGCVPTVGLAKPLKEYIVSGCPEAASKMVTLEDIPDPLTRKIIEDIGKADSKLIEDLNSDEEVQNLMLQSGCSQALISCNNKNVVALEIMVYIVIYKRIREMEQLRQGIDSLSLCTVLRRHQGIRQLLFPTEAESVISLDVAKRIVRSNPKDDDEKRILQFFLHYLEEVSTKNEGVDLKSVMIFITAAARPSTIQIKFLKESQSLPDPDTCLGTLTLSSKPLDYEKFKSDFDNVVPIQGRGFGRS